MSEKMFNAAIRGRGPFGLTEDDVWLWLSSTYHSTACDFVVSIDGMLLAQNLVVMNSTIAVTTSTPSG